MEEAVSLGVEKFSFTGGEPFVIKDIIRILDYALNLKPALVLTNATEPLKMRLDDLKPFLQKPYPLHLRISNIDGDGIILGGRGIIRVRQVLCGFLI